MGLVCVAGRHDLVEGEDFPDPSVSWTPRPGRVTRATAFPSRIGSLQGRTSFSTSARDPPSRLHTGAGCASLKTVVMEEPRSVTAGKILISSGGVLQTAELIGELDRAKGNPRHIPGLSRTRRGHVLD